MAHWHCNAWTFNWIASSVTSYREVYCACFYKFLVSQAAVKVQQAAVKVQQ